jgi:hypothetical protein
VSKPLPLESGERVSALRTTRRNASRSCSMRPNPLHGVGARFSQVGLAGIGASRCSAQEAAVWQSDPKRAVPARMTMDARDRTRPSEAPPARWRGGSAPEPKAPPAVNVLATRSTARCLGTKGSVEADALYGASPVASPGARTHGTCLQPPIGQRYCLITSPCEPRKRRRVMRRLVQAPGMARSGSSRR